MTLPAATGGGRRRADWPACMRAGLPFNHAPRYDLLSLCVSCFDTLRSVEV